MSSSKKIVVVFGATGNQGGSVINALLSDPKTAHEFKIRGITRDPTKANAKALEKRGVECVAGDVNDKESLRQAFEGAYAVFAVTNYWEKMDAGLEVEQGRAIADLAKEAGIQHLIWSSLLNITELSNGKFPHVEHFDSKARVEAYIRSLSIPATFFLPGFYMSNLPNQMLRPLPPSNAWTIAMPAPSTTPVPLFDVAADTGKFVKGILTHREEVLGKRVYAATEYYTWDEVLGIFKELFPEAGKDARFVQVSREEYMGALAGAGMPEKAQVELCENMAFMYDFGYYGKAGLEESHAILDEKPTTLKEFFEKTKAFEGLK